MEHLAELSPMMSRTTRRRLIRYRRCKVLALFGSGSRRLSAPVVFPGGGFNWQMRPAFSISYCNISLKCYQAASSTLASSDSCSWGMKTSSGPRSFRSAVGCCLRPTGDSGGRRSVCSYWSKSVLALPAAGVALHVVARFVDVTALAVEGSGSSGVGKASLPRGPVGVSAT